MNRIVAKLKPGREKPIVSGHPWIFSGAIASWSATPQTGQQVDVVSSGNEWLARGLASPDGNLAIRIYTRVPDTELDDAFFCGKLSDAIAWRESDIYPQETDTDSFRLCFSESDGLSGLIVDRYADHAGIQLNTSLLMTFVPALQDTLTQRGFNTIIHQDKDNFALDGGARSANAFSEAASAKPLHHIRESGFKYRVDLTGGQKTGFYLDQRVNRRRAARYARGRKCLSAYCYTGAFEMHLANAGASHITGLDSSETAIEQAKQNHVLNPTEVPIDYTITDVPHMLRKYRDNRTSFDMIILDPPKFVSNQGQIDKGLRAYKDINLLAMKLLNPGGILVTFSCSGWVKTEQFKTALEWASGDAGREIQILEHLTQPPDHPILLSFPESDYLCGYVLRVV